MWDLWLLVATIAMVAFGVAMALFSRTSLFSAFEANIDPAFWESGSLDAGTRLFQAWAYGVWGATVAGFAILAAFLVGGPYRRRERWARDALVPAVAVWFVLDTGISAYYGVWFNVGFNCAILAALAIPLGATWKQFVHDGRGGSASHPPLG